MHEVATRPSTEVEQVAALAHRSLAVAVILAFTAGCDNVEWGGASVVLEPPPPATVGVDTLGDTLAAGSADALPPPPLPTGAVLYAGTRAGGSVTLRPLFEFRGDTIVALTDEADAPGYNEHFAATLLAPGTEFTLFADGVRVGTLVADSAGVDAGWCGPGPRVDGVPELSPAASDAVRFLALARADDRGERPHGTGAFPAVGADDLETSRLLGQTAIMRVDALWPDDLSAARADLALTRIPADTLPTVTATFMFRDRLAVVDADNPAAYSLFVLGARRDGRVRLDYTWYRRIGTAGKAAPRFFQSMDIDADGRPEIVLEVMGAVSRWPAVLRLGSRGWDVVHEVRCPAEAAAASGG